MTQAGKMLREVLRSVGKKADTVRYPHDKLTMCADFRGRLRPPVVVFRRGP